jgi:hypothetical protein
LVALVPDPVRTHMALNFDRAIDSIIGAATDQGLTLQAYFIPWERSPYTATDTPSLRWQQQDERELREKLPGILVFNRAALLDQLAVFLVAESATIGVDRYQFRDAIGRIAEQKKTAQKENDYDILGPTFTGSLPSLADLLEEPATKLHLPKKVVATTVTGKAGVDWFRARVEKSLAFTTTLYDDEAAWTAFTEHLKYQHPRVALLSETETSYGTEIANSAAAVNTEPVLKVRFPRAISRLRNASNEQVPAAGEKVPPGAAAPSRGLPLLLKDSSDEGADTVPTFSLDQTALSEEALLGQIGRLLREQRTEVAQVSATDVLDVLFVSKYLRTACPNIRLVFLDADLLYARAAEELPFVGLQSVSQYPLLPLVPRLPRPNQPPPPAQAPNHALFSSALAEAIYDATSSLLRPLDSPAQPVCSQPLWVTAVGRNGYWPVARLTEGAGSCDVRSVSDKDFENQIDKPGPTLAVRNAMLLFFAACLVWAGLLTAGQFSKSRRVADFRLGETPESRVQRAAHLLAVTLSLRLMCSLAAAPFERLSSWPEGMRPLALSAAFALFLWAVILSIVLLWRALRHPLRFANALTLGVVSWAGYFLIFDAWGDTLESGSHMAGFFAAWRSVDFANGLAPVVPLLMLLAGIGYWSWTQHQRQIFLDEREQRLGNFGDSDPVWTREVEPAYQRVRDYLHRAWHGSWIALLATVLLMFGFAWLAEKPLHTLEPGPFDLLFRALLVVFLGHMALMALQFVMTWSRLRIFLVRLEYHPVREGLSLLPADHSWSPIWQFSARRRNFSHLVRASDALIALGMGEQNRLPETLGTVFREHANGRREDHTMFLDVNAEFDRLHAILAWFVAPYWERRMSQSIRTWEEEEAVKDSAKITTAERDAEIPFLLAQEFLALRYVAFIRYVMLHLRNMLEFLSTGFILGALALNAYPFQAPRLVGWWTLGAFAAIGFVIVFVLLEMNRDAVLSRISNTKANQLDRHFVLQLAEIGALPLLALISTNVPAVSRFFFSWVEPALAAFH